LKLILAEINTKIMHFLLIKNAIHIPNEG